MSTEGRVFNFIQDELVNIHKDFPNFHRELQEYFTKRYEFLKELSWESSDILKFLQIEVNLLIGQFSEICNQAMVEAGYILANRNKKETKDAS